MTIDSYLNSLGINNTSGYHYGLCSTQHAETALRRGEGILSNHGALIINTGEHTGRSPNDKYIVQHDKLDNIWWGKINQPLSPESYHYLYQSLIQQLNNNDCFIDDVQIGQDPNHRLNVRMISTHAWSGLFCRNLFIPIADENPSLHPDVTILHAPDFFIDKNQTNLHSSTFIVLNLIDNVILIGGSAYAGEIKKSVFSLMNYLMPKAGVLPMHCSANVSKEGDVALFFGLSGTGKTTLSSTPDRQLIGDDEHGWSDTGIFNFEGGCYAKTIRLSQDLEPMIWRAVHRFGTLMENVVVNPTTRIVDFNSAEITENTRAAYPLHYIDNYFQNTVAGHPSNIFFLTADASGVLPPISRLSPDQAMYYFLAGYTSKLAGTEVDLGSQPQATFSTCFAAPFLPLHPMVYASLLGERIRQHRSNIWLVNTGWSGGMYGIGKRMHLPHTRAMIKAALDGKLSKVDYKRNPLFNLEIPTTCPGVPDALLDAKSTWQDQSSYSKQALILINKFNETMEQYRDQVTKNVIQAGPTSTISE
ncbi:MAG: phosphoenolpyruvate carboxykinase (ATP) [Anaerolineaceae bacterium]|nr:phosphoenolpyruvate carboxykinase (ATP) [Anaerolineaceae bacterium]